MATAQPGTGLRHPRKPAAGPAAPRGTDRQLPDHFWARGNAPHTGGTKR
jgi:hypothetical protein